MSLEPGTAPARPAETTPEETAPEETAPGTGVLPAAAPAGVDEAAPPAPPQLRIKRTRISGAWFALGAFAVVLLFLLIFILQNNHTVEVSYLGAHGHLPLGVALLMGAIAGVLLAVLIGAARIIQLRATARRHRRADSRNAAAQQASVTSSS